MEACTRMHHLLTLDLQIPYGISIYMAAFVRMQSVS